ncbi:hypothetical protein CF319_g9177, partial [Tilletia indica]
MGNGSNSQTLYDLANYLFKGYGVEITNYRLYRLCLLRALCRKHLPRGSSSNATNEHQELPDDFWASVSKTTTTMMKEAVSDDDHKEETFKTLKKMMASDMDKYGAFQMLEDAAMVKAEKEIDVCIAEAQGMVSSLAVDYLDRTRLSQIPEPTTRSGSSSGGPSAQSRPIARSTTRT